ncbi:MAG TPA: 4-hydroxy-3-methylbut-2-enyl diphosphate reductase [Candidatus Kerfeldbacteria bacterium]|nr:MAG: 4-hydroxy-3-methylbut-2-enyl diphosphate reductase [Parcubacteria group bacterium GW2011_GWA2_48_9]KKW16047.1 MAG: 4-hydroxy-3-methylbut-2-enyl diphosphate reductase [Parcubacteria group bacterium GW2011_GWC2_49_9]HCM67667.1 4-hydroxy-3-methylbut-2-enyl diphosphate reductase [Candidatus Kerfeldbacteria bacterium]
MKVILAKPRGFCAGVDRAIDVVELALQVYGKPVYVKHAIVHNDHVVRDLEQKGTIFIESVDEIPEGAHAVFSAHGSPPSDYEKAKARKLNLIDATCPLVTKVHLEAKRFGKEGYMIILVGHKGHVELRGTSGEAPDHTMIVETVEDVDALKLPVQEKIAVLTQTTLSVDDTKTVLDVIRKKYPGALFPPSSDICYATTNRQRAVKELAKHVQLVLVVGSHASSNTNRLVEVAKNQGVPAYRINSANDIETSWLKGVEVVGLTSGASAPEELVQSVIEFLRKHGADEVEELEVLQERVWFNLPMEIREAAKARGIDASLIQKHHIARGVKMSVKE